MINNESVGLVIPCHNEEAGLKRLLPLVPKEVDHILIIDNNCTDTTATIARQFGAEIVTEKIPGYGQAYQAGFKAIQTDIVVTMDGDGQYPVEDIPRLVPSFQKRNLDFLSASRFPMKTASMPLLRQIGNILLTAAATILFGTRIKDTQSGMWIFRRTLLQKVQPKENGMPFSEEFKIKVIQAGLSFGEEHIVYQERSGISKLVPFADGWRNLLYLIRLRFE